MTVVAPNSPSEMAKAKPAATSRARRTSGRSTSRQTRAGEAPRTAAASRRRWSIEREHRRHRAHDERQRDHGLGERHEPRAGPQVDGASSAMRNPKPTVTAEVPSGSSSSDVDARGRRGPGARPSAAAARPPSTTARTVATAAKRSELPSASSGGTKQAGVRVDPPRRPPAARPGRRRCGTTARRATPSGEPEEHRQERAGSRATHARSAPRPGAAPPRRAQRRRPRPPGAARAGPATSEHRGDRGQLEQREHGGHREVQEVGGLPVDLHLEGAVRRPAEEADHAERGEGEEEGDRGRRRRWPGRSAGRVTARKARRPATHRAPGRPPRCAGRAAPTARRPCGRPRRWLKNAWARRIAQTRALEVRGRSGSPGRAARRTRRRPPPSGARTARSRALAPPAGRGTRSARGRGRAGSADGQRERRRSAACQSVNQATWRSSGSPSTSPTPERSQRPSPREPLADDVGDGPDEERRRGTRAGATSSATTARAAGGVSAARDRSTRRSRSSRWASMSAGRQLETVGGRRRVLREDRRAAACRCATGNTNI